MDMEMNQGFSHDVIVTVLASIVGKQQGAMSFTGRNLRVKSCRSLDTDLRSLGLR